MGKRICSDCGEEKLLDQFRLRESGRSRRPYCLACDRARKRAHYVANKEGHRAAGQRWRERNLDRDREYHRRYQAENAERARAWKKAYKQRQRDPERAARHAEGRALLALGQKRCTKCGDIKPLLDFDRRGAPKRHLYLSRCKACMREGRAAQVCRVLKVRLRPPSRRQRIQAAFVERVDRFHVFERDSGVCGICGGDVNPKDFHVDHVVPVALGGEHSYANVQLAHPKCNRRKAAKLRR